MKISPTTIYAIGAIFILEVIALYQGVNGSCLALSIAALAGLGGYEIGRLKKK